MCGHVHTTACQFTGVSPLTVEFPGIVLWFLSGVFSCEIKDVRYLDGRKTIFSTVGHCACQENNLKSEVIYWKLEGYTNFYIEIGYFSKTITFQFLCWTSFFKKNLKSRLTKKSALLPTTNVLNRFFWLSVRQQIRSIFIINNRQGWLFMADLLWLKVRIN